MASKGDEYSCDICKLSFSYLSSLQRHLSTKNHLFAAQCLAIKQRPSHISSSAETIQENTSTAFGEHEPHQSTAGTAFCTSYYCNVCCEGFSFKSYFDRHLLTKAHKSLLESLAVVNTTLTYSSPEINPLETYTGCQIHNDDAEDIHVANSSDSDISEDEGGTSDEHSCLLQVLSELSESDALDFSPFPNKLFALLFFLLHGPRPLGQTSISFVWFILREHGSMPPSISQVKNFRLPGYNDISRSVSPNGIPFYHIKMSTILSQCLGTPKIASTVVRYPVSASSYFKEIYHGNRWNNEERFFTPMIRLNSGLDVYLRDFISFQHSQLGITHGVVTKFFQKESCSDVFFEVDLLLDASQFKYMVPDSTVYYLPENTWILFGKSVHCVTSIHSVQPTPAGIVKWNSSDGTFQRFSCEEISAFVSPHQLKEKAACRRIVMVPLILFSDDTSGNKSKKWNKFECWYLLLGGLPKHENAKIENIHFLCCSDKMDALDMAQPIAQELLQLETEGVEVFDAHHQEYVHVIAPLLCVICDNPRSSQLLNHLGASANKYCRFCMADRNETPHLVCEQRTTVNSLQHMPTIVSQRCEEAKSQKRTLFGVREDFNPLLHIPCDLYKSTPVEVLHTILLGPCKYFLKVVMPTLSKVQKGEILARMKSFSLSGFSVRVYGNVCQHYKSFVGRDYKAWTQMVLFILKPYITDGQMKVLLNLCKVFRIAYCGLFHPVDADCYQQTCQDFVDAVKHSMPELLHKQKVHYFLHLVQSMIDYGPSSAFSAERCESFNSFVRLQNIFSNKQAPSRDIAKHFSVLEHLRYICQGGYYGESERCGIGLKNLFSLHCVQHFLNCMPQTDTSKLIHKCGAARKASPPLKSLGSLVVTTTGIKDIRFDQLCLTYPQFVILNHSSCTMTDNVLEHRAVVPQVLDMLANNSDYVELCPPFQQFQYGQIVTICTIPSGMVLCFVRGFEAMELSNGVPLLNEFDCPLYTLSCTIFPVVSCSIHKPVSMVHECGNSCVFKAVRNVSMTEREQIETSQCVFTHDWNNPLYCRNVFCV